MEDKYLKKLLQDLSKEQAAVPSHFFTIKMRLKLYQKAFFLNFRQRGVKNAHTFRFAGSMLILVLTLTGGMGVYAYTSPEVNALNPFYPVKQGMEAVEYAFTNTPEEQLTFHRKQALRRLEEAEVIARNHQPSSQVRKEEVLKKTLQNIEENIELSLSSTPEQAEPESAKELLSTFDRDFEKINTRLKKVEVNVQEKRSQEKLKEVQVFMKDRMETMQKVSHDVDEIKDKKAKIMLRQKLMKKQQKLNERMQKLPAQGEEVLPSTRLLEREQVQHLNGERN